MNGRPLRFLGLVTGGWIAMLQHHFFAAWIPGDKDQGKFSLAAPRVGGAMHAVIRDVGPGVSVAPGADGSSNAAIIDLPPPE